MWLDTQDAQPGADWDAQIAEAIQTCRGLLFVMSADSVQEHTVCKSERVWAPLLLGVARPAAAGEE